MTDPGARGELGGSQESAAVIQRFAGDPPSPFEGLFGYSRVVTAGPFVLIAGTTSIDEHGFVVGVTPYEQAVEVFRKLGSELARAGLGFSNVVQTRIYVTDISRGDEVGRAHAAVLGAVRPITTMVEVSALIDPRMLVEIELVAYRDQAGAGS